jgi:epoxyqueuosine reductase
MTSARDIIDAGYGLGFQDVGFTTAEPFEDHRRVLTNRRERYAWAPGAGLDLFAGTDPAAFLTGARSIIVLLDVYFNGSFPRSLEGHFGRCYLDDDRVTRTGLSRRIKDFRTFLRDRGIDSRVPGALPHRMAAARAGLGTFGKNCLFYAREAARGGSWTLPIPVVVDREFEPGVPTLKIDCPDWCRNACIAACPTRALEGGGRMDPRRCISFLTYYGEGLTPLELREPMGMWVYGCDRCQDVCPRNRPWLAQDLPVNGAAAEKTPWFDLRRLLHMDRVYFEARIRPHMFYM